MASFTPQEIEQFLQEFFDVVGARQYVGARYVPIFGRAGEDTVEWDNGAPYEPLTVVMHEGVSYVSRRYVPKDIEITDTAYWVETYRFNAQVEQYRQEVLAFDDRITANANAIQAEHEAMESAIDGLADTYIAFPDGTTYPKYGTLGQVLSTLEDGDVKWEDPVIVTSEIAGPLIEEWLNDHPEATTTVQDGSITFAKLATSLIPYFLRSTNKHVNASVPASLQDFANADLQPHNTVYLINQNITSAQVSNLPVYGDMGLLIKLNFDTTNGQGCVQMFIGAPLDNLNATKFYVRFAVGGGTTPTFGNWICVYPIENGSITFDKLAQSVLPHFMRPSNVHLNASVPSSLQNFTDADLQPNSTVYLVNQNITSSLVSNLPVYGDMGLLIKFNFDTTLGQGCVQMFIGAPLDGLSNARFYVRFAVGAGTTPTFGDWNEIPTPGTIGRLAAPSVLSNKTCTIFRKVVACGDSYTSGWINNVHTNEDYAWPHYMELLTGNDYINCGHSGATVLSWQTLERGLPKAVQTGVSQAYIIGLMINDVNTGVPLGAISDIGTQAETYYGGLSQIVEALNRISPNAKIFIQTCPRTNATYQLYNQAVRDVVNYYASTMHTHLLDLAAYMYLYDKPSISEDASLGHYTAIGYQQFAENLAYVMSDYINTHISAFQDVYSLPTS